MDLEIAYDYDINEQKSVLDMLSDDLELFNLPATIFSTAEAIDLFRKQTIKLHANSNEIGCHGVNHCMDENYKKMNRDEISKNILTATHMIEDIIKQKPVSFRGPGMTTSILAQKILLENGYSADFSVCSQRADIFSTAGGDMSWLFSPRTPYHPSNENPFRRGHLPIWVVPLSCIGLPFISGILYLFGLDFMKLFFHLLLKEASLTSKPIVYLFHSYEFCNYTGNLTSKQVLLAERRNKRKVIHRLYRNNPSERYNMNKQFLNYMLSCDIIQPFTGKSYVQLLNTANNESRLLQNTN